MFAFILLGLKISVNEDLQASLVELIYGSHLRFSCEFFEEEKWIILIPTANFPTQVVK